MANQVIQSYMAALGFNINQQQFNHFQAVLQQAQTMAKSSAAGVAGEFTAMAAAVAGAYGLVGAATIALMERTANADLSYRMFARRMYMNEEAAKRLKIALDTLGVSMEDVVWGPPEIARRFARLQRDQMTAQAGLGPDFRGNMEQLRNWMFEFNRLEMNLQYLGQSVVQDIARAFGTDLGGFFKKFQEWNDYLLSNLPKITQQINSVLVPVLKDGLQIFKDLFAIGKEFLGLFSMRGDALEGFQNILWLVKQISWELRSSFGEVRDVMHGITATFSANKLLVTGHFKEAWEMYKEGMSSYWRAMSSDYGRAIDKVTGQGAAPNQYTPTTGAIGSTDLRELARQAGRDLGMDPALIFGQWWHETGGFTSPAFRRGYNLAGIQAVPGQPSSPEGNAVYGSLSEAFRAYENVLQQSRYAAARSGRSDVDFITGLKRGGYYEDNPANYLRGVREGERAFADNRTINVNVQVAATNADPRQIGDEVAKQVKEKLSAQANRGILQLQTAYP